MKVMRHRLFYAYYLVSKITGLMAKIRSDVLFFITLKLLWMYIFGCAVDSGRMD